MHESNQTRDAHFFNSIKLLFFDSIHQFAKGKSREPKRAALLVVLKTPGYAGGSRELTAWYKKNLTS